MGKHFSFAELELVRDCYPIMTSTEIARLLGRPNPKSIRNVANELGIVKETKWTADQLRVLRVQYGSCDLDWLCRRLGRSRWSVHHKVRELGLQYRGRWTLLQDAILRRDWKKNDDWELAANVGRSMLAVRARAQRLGLTRQCARSGKIRRWWTSFRTSAG